LQSKVFQPLKRWKVLAVTYKRTDVWKFPLTVINNGFRMRLEAHCPCLPTYRNKSEAYNTFCLPLKAVSILNKTRVFRF
jgi:hypothetical protein